MSTAPPASHKTDPALEAHLRAKRIDSFTTICRDAIKWSAAVIIVAYGYKSIVALAGHRTYADIGIRVLGNLKVSDGILYLFGVSGWVYGLGERRLRRNNIRRLAPAKNDLERIIDPRRTSSNLTTTGTTQPGDDE
jgi:hypothetical protein